MANDKLTTTRHPGVYRRARDGRLVIRATAKDEKTGQIRQIKRTLAPDASVAEALELLGAMKVQARRGGAHKSVAVVPTLRACVPRWTRSRLTSGAWNADGGTIPVVAARLEGHVLPVFGDFLLDKIAYADLADWLATMKAKGLAPTTIEPIYSHLKCLIRDSRRDLGLPPLSDWPPAPKTTGRDKATPLGLSWDNYAQTNEGMALTRAQLGTFLNAAEGLDPNGWYPMAVLGFASDARFSELTACIVDDLKLDDEIGVWLVRRHWVVSRKATAPGTKRKPEGEIRLLDGISTTLLRAHWQRRRLAAGPEALMFPPSGRAKGAQCRSHQGFQKFLDRVSAVTDLPRMTSKVMRRTYLTLAHLEAMADAMAQAQAGHTTPEMSARYVKPSIEARKEHAAKMGSVLYLPTAAADGTDDK